MGAAVDVDTAAVPDVNCWKDSESDYDPEYCIPVSPYSHNISTCDSADAVAAYLFSDRHHHWDSFHYLLHSRSHYHIRNSDHGRSP